MGRATNTLPVKPERSSEAEANFSLDECLLFRMLKFSWHSIGLYEIQLFLMTLQNIKVQNHESCVNRKKKKKKKYKNM